MTKVVFEVELDDEELEHPRWSAQKAVARIMKVLSAWWFVESVEKGENQ